MAAPAKLFDTDAPVLLNIARMNGSTTVKFLALQGQGSSALSRSVS